MKYVGLHQLLMNYQDKISISAVIKAYKKFNRDRIKTLIKTHFSERIKLLKLLFKSERSVDEMNTVHSAR